MILGILAVPVFTGAVILLLNFAGIRTYVVLSGSMEPSIPTGSAVFTDTSAVTPVPGTVITFRLGEQDVTHRVVRLEKEGCITKGDANTAPDPITVEQKDIIGTVRFAIPCAGYLIAFCTRRAVMAVLILLAVLLMLAAPADKRKCEGTEKGSKDSRKGGKCL